MRPIEEGCRAVTRFPSEDNNGKVVIVGKFIGEMPDWEGDTYWEIDTPLVSRLGVQGYHCLENNLIRIDDDTTTWDKMKDIWQPEKYKEEELV